MTWWSTASTPAMVIDVEAGTPSTICFGETLDLSTLGASISGDVSDGLWFSQGDGVFLPGATSNGVFSATTQYQPGQQDQSNGSFTLILVSDDPDGNGPMVEVSDVVTITFMNPPALVCNNSINVSLADGCTQPVDVTMLLANPSQPYDKYTIELYDANGNLLPNDTLTVDQLGTEVTFVVGHDCTSSTCDGLITVNDNIAPFLNCIDSEVSCQDGTDPENTGFPIPFYATATANGDGSYDVINFDDCGVVTLTYSDITESLECNPTGYVREITRTWTAVDQSDNTSGCVQTILLLPLALTDVVLPQNYDGNDNPALSCDGGWIALDNGYPSPETTGSPSFPACGNIATNYADVEFEECGAGFKVLRQWTIVDWCTATTINHNQIIKILDIEGPQFDCPDDLTISTQAYSCTSLLLELDTVNVTYDCSQSSTSYQIWTLDSIDISSTYLTDNQLEGLPLGQYLLRYIATDECNNNSVCQTTITVVDESNPFAVCDGFTKIAVGSNGMAELFASSVDDESFDNCGDITMEIAKMTDQCAWGLNFGPKARFCCEEIGDTVMVAFRVTDEAGLSNTCMVSVLIEDKLPPAITCPDDLTISCLFNYDDADLSIFGTMSEGSTPDGNIIINGTVQGQNGYYSDNCNATLSETSNIDIDCGSGTITRTFTVTDDYDQENTCTQTITVINDQPFLESDITWPQNSIMNGCDTIQASLDVTGEPVFSGDRCALVAATFTDQIFYISGGACIKILREWTVIDWCQYDPSSGQGLWTQLQEIKLMNSIAPSFLSCQDMEVCSYDEDCMSEEVTITALAEDDCTDSIDLVYLWELDLDNDGIVDDAGQGHTFIKDLTLGTHSVSWTVEDGCGNIEFCTHEIEVIDCKNPTPFCHSSITTTIMPSTGEIDIWAVDYDLGSTDNCTPAEELIFSFSADINDTQRIINCDDIENGIAGIIELEMWVTDEHGNQESCAVEFIVQDSDNNCADMYIKGELRGQVSTQDGKLLPEVEIDIVASMDTFSGFDMTDVDGLFNYGKTPKYLEYVVKPYYNSSPSSGVSTIDLVKMQQHILEINTFDNPYDIIASDVSQNQRLTSSDLLTMRKMILGIITEWPKDIDNWVFVDSTFIFEEMDYPYFFPDSVIITALDDSTEAINFVAVKMGDINGSYNPLSENGPQSSARSGAYIDMVIKQREANNRYTYDLKIETEDAPDGLQFSIKVPQDAVITSDFIANYEYHIVGDEMRVSWTNPSQLSLTDRVFLTVTSNENMAPILTPTMAPEVYFGDDILELSISETITSIESESTATSVKVLGNPFSEALQILLGTTPSKANISISDIHGNIVYRRKSISETTVSIDGNVFPTSGVYFVNIDMGGEVMTKKVVKVEK